MQLSGVAKWKLTVERVRSYTGPVAAAKKLAVRSPYSPRKESLQPRLATADEQASQLSFEGVRGRVERARTATTNLPPRSSYFCQALDRGELLPSPRTCIQAQRRHQSRQVVPSRESPLKPAPFESTLRRGAAKTPPTT